jgi:2-hydroxy-6-oxonona-2,4-dienedioate hydrolase
MNFDSTSRYLETASGRQHYNEAGEGPPLLFLHGSGPGVSGWTNFGDNLPAFTPHFRCLVLDLPGYGRSDPAAGHPITAGVDAVRNFLDALDIARADLLGNSYGAIVGCHLAANYPQRVRRFVTLGGFGFTPFAPFPAEGILRLVEFVEEPTRERLVTWMKSMVFDERVLTEAMIDARYKTACEPKIMATSKVMYSRAGIAAIAQRMRGPDALADIAHLPRIKCPTLILWGRDDRVNPLDGALLPMRSIPDCELHVFPNCGHWAMIERKAQFEQVALGFLLRNGLDVA